MLSDKGSDRTECAWASCSTGGLYRPIEDEKVPLCEQHFAYARLVFEEYGKPTDLKDVSFMKAFFWDHVGYPGRD